MSESRIIPPEFKLPCAFRVGRTTFRKGVSLETVRQAAERWWKEAAKSSPLNAKLSTKERDEMIAKITDENRHPETLTE